MRKINDAIYILKNKKVKQEICDDMPESPGFDAKTRGLRT
jgi:hypothetical protein